MLLIIYRLPNITGQLKQWHGHKPFFLSIATVLFLTGPFLFLLFLCTRTLILVVVDSLSFKLEEFPNKMAISSAQNSRDKSFFLKKLITVRMRASVLNIWSNCILFCLLISSSLSLMHTSKTPVGFPAPFGRPSASLEFLYSLSLYPFCPRHNSWRRSLLMLVLSHSDTHHFNTHMVGCGCHEILISCSVTVLLSTSFLVISISRVEGEGKFM